MTLLDRYDRPGDPDAVHACLPNMGYACGETILSVAGRFELGARNWDKITCPGCRTWGQDYLLAISAWQQGHGDHPDALAPTAPEHHTINVGEQMDLFKVAS